VYVAVDRISALAPRSAANNLSRKGVAVLRTIDLRALDVIAARADADMGVIVFEAEQAGVEAGPLRNLQLEGLIEVMDDDGHPTIFLTQAGRAALRRLRTLDET
jgi:hypothetical protein